MSVYSNVPLERDRPEGPRAMATRSRSHRSSAEQGDLFGDRVLVPASPSVPVAPPDLDGYDDQEIIALVPKANLSNVEGLCGQILQRGPGQPGFYRDPEPGGDAAR